MNRQILVAGMCAVLLVGCGDDDGGVCGDDAQQSGEICDGIDLGGNDCTTIGQGFTGGALVCRGTCDGWDTSGCTQSVCSNGALESGETCDGTLLEGQDCTTIGQNFSGGALGCNATCDDWDTTGCTSGPCGNGTLDPGEICDDTLLDGQDCATIGQNFSGGLLGCNETCDGWYTDLCIYEELTNFPANCDQWGGLWPDSGEEQGQFMVRLTPSSYPFTVRRLQYVLPNRSDGGVTCDASLAHDVMVFVDASDIPPPSPTPLATFSVPSEPVTDYERIVQLDLVSPITVQADEKLWVSVGIAGTTPTVLCVETCLDASDFELGRNWFTADPAAPYAWFDLGHYGLQVNMNISAHGNYD